MLTGLLGGAAVATLRIGDPTYPMTVCFGMMAWGGLYLIGRRLRTLIPLRAPVNSHFGQRFRGRSGGVHWRIFPPALAAKPRT